MRINIGKLLRIVERSNKGWIRAGVLPPCRVYGDGKLIPMVVRVHRKSGRVVVFQAVILLARVGYGFLMTRRARLLKLIMQPTL